MFSKCLKSLKSFITLSYSSSIISCVRGNFVEFCEKNIINSYTHKEQKSSFKNSSTLINASFLSISFTLFSNKYLLSIYSFSTDINSTFASDNSEYTIEQLFCAKYCETAPPIS